MCLKAVVCVRLPLDLHNNIPLHEVVCRFKVDLSAQTFRRTIAGLAHLLLDSVFFDSRSDETTRRSTRVRLRSSSFGSDRRQLPKPSHFRHGGGATATQRRRAVDTRPSLTTFGGVMTFRWTIAAAMETGDVIVNLIVSRIVDIFASSA